MKRQTRKLFCFLLSLVMMTTFLFSPAMAVGDSGTAGTNSTRTTITPDLAEVLSTAGATDLIPVSIWIAETDIDAVEQAALEETGLNKARIAELYAEGVELDSKEIDTYIEAERRIYAERQMAVSEQFLQRAFGTASIDTPLVERETYVSKYTPSIQTELTKAEIQSISGNVNVETIYYSPNLTLAAEEVLESTDSTTEESMTLSEALAAISVPYTRDTLGYTGKGIKIGQVELGVPDVTLSYLSGADITCRPGDAVDNEHASVVAGIMVSQDATQKGVVPDASLYSAGFEGSNVKFKDMLIAIEWLLDQNVGIINASAGWNSDGYYNDFVDKCTEHLAINHSVHFVAAVGNSKNYDGTDNTYLASPGMAYNVITVGAANVALNGRASFSKYRGAKILSSKEPYADKPDILAPGENIKMFNQESLDGTSYSAPMVTGIAVQLMQANPILKTCQDSLKACLLAGIKDETLRFVPSDINTSENAISYSTCGAGLVNAQSAMYSTRRGLFTVNQNFAAGTSAGTTKTYTFTVSSSDDLMRVALTWLKYEKYSSSDHISGTLTSGNYVNLDLKVTAPSGKNVYSSTVDYGNVEIVQFEPKESGTYTITITIKNSPTQKTYFSVAWW